MWTGSLEGWDDDTINQLYQARSDLVLEALESETESVRWDALDERMKVIAAFSLAQEGFLVLNAKDSESIRLTATGVRFARGARALSKG